MQLNRNRRRKRKIRALEKDKRLRHRVNNACRTKKKTHGGRERDVTRSRPAHWKRWEGVSGRCIIRVITLTSLLPEERRGTAREPGRGEKGGKHDGDKGMGRRVRGRKRKGKGARWSGVRGRGRLEAAVDALLPANAGLLCIIKAMCSPGPFMQATVHEEICIQRHANAPTSIGTTPIHEATRSGDSLREHSRTYIRE